VKLDVSTRWWRSLSRFPWVAVTKRLKFGDGQGAAPFQSAIVYLGEDCERFRLFFGKYGVVYREVAE
jgi:hypothetical protein